MLVDRLHPPLGAHPVVIMLAVICLLAGALVLTWPLFSKLIAGRVTGLAVPAHVRTKYLTKIAEVEAELDTGSVTGRGAAQKLGELVRQFAQDAWGYKVDYMTLHELRYAGIAPIAQTIERLYAAEFAKQEPTHVESLFTDVRKLVGMWS